MIADKGQTLSHYRLLEKIGEGGMGVVWKAEDNVLHRTVAIKLLPAALAQDDNRRRMFLEEACLASSVSDMHIAQVYELGRQGDLDFIVMEYVEGKTLSKVIHGRPLPPDRVAALAEQVARALSRAHRKGLLHRDLKPANIMVTAEGDVKVVDFGLATLYSPLESTLTTAPDIPSTPGMTQNETARDERPSGKALAGTLAYMSPEQARGDPLDPRSDIFSLGAVLYEMTTGHRPFDGTTYADILQEVQKAHPVPVHERVPKVPHDLDKLIQKALAPHREERYQTMEDLAVDLKRLGRDLEAGSSPSHDELIRPLERARERRVRWTVAVGALILAAAGLGVWLGSSRMEFLTRLPAPDDRTVLIFPLEVRGQGEEPEYVGRAFAEAIVTELAEAKDLKVLPVPTAGLTGPSDSFSPARTARAAGAGRLVTGALTREGEFIRASLSLLDAAENRVLWGIHRRGSDDQMPALASFLARETAAKLGGNFPKLYDLPQDSPGGPKMAASPLFSEAVGAMKRNEIPATLETTERLVAAFPDEPDAHALRADALMRAWERDPSSANRRALDEGLVALERADPQHFYCEVKRAYLQGREGQPREAMERITRVLARDDLSPRARAYALGMRAQAERVAGDLDASLTDAEEALRLSPTNATILQNLGETLRNAGRFEEALVRIRQAAALSPSNPLIQATLSIILVNLGRMEEAVAPSAKACELSRNQVFCATYAIALQRVGREVEARMTARMAEGLTENGDGVYNLGCFWALAGKHSEAIRLLRRAVELGDIDSYIARDPDLVSLHGDLAFEGLVAEVKRRLAPESALER